MPPRVPIPHHLGTAPFSTRKGASAGLGRGRMRGPDLARPYRGVRMPFQAAPTVETLCRALQLRLPAASFFSGVTAAAVMGIPLPSRLSSSRRLQVSVPAPLRAPTGEASRVTQWRFGTTKSGSGTILLSARPRGSSANSPPSSTSPILFLSATSCCGGCFRSPPPRPSPLRSRAIRAVEEFAFCTPPARC